METTEFPIEADSRLEQPSNASCPIVVTLFGMSIVLRFSQKPKAEIPIVVTLFPKSIEDMMDSANAYYPIAVTLSGILNELFPGQLIIVVLSLEYSTPSSAE